MKQLFSHRRHRLSQREEVIGEEGNGSPDAQKLLPSPAIRLLTSGAKHTLVTDNG